MIRKLFLVLIVLVLAAQVGACGRKAPPEYPEGSDHPRTYPTR
jgi:hypothetical protein